MGDARVASGSKREMRSLGTLQESFNPRKSPASARVLRWSNYLHNRATRRKVRFSFSRPHDRQTRGIIN